jgi:hemerythrin
MSVQWTPALAVGVEIIDRQHKELFRHVDNLMEAMKRARGRTEIGKMVAFLGAYVVEHFQEEEKYMQEFAYPDYKSHKQEHDSLVQEYGGMKNTFLSSGLNAIEVVKIQRRLVDWLEHHIGEADKALGLFLVGKVKSA